MSQVENAAATVICKLASFSYSSVEQLIFEQLSVKTKTQFFEHDASAEDIAAYFSKALDFAADFRNDKPQEPDVQIDENFLNGLAEKAAEVEVVLEADVPPSNDFDKTGGPSSRKSLREPPDVDKVSTGSKRDTFQQEARKNTSIGDFDNSLSKALSKKSTRQPEGDVQNDQVKHEQVVVKSLSKISSGSKRESQIAKNTSINPDQNNFQNDQNSKISKKDQSHLSSAKQGSIHAVPDPQNAPSESGSYTPSIHDDQAAIKNINKVSTGSKRSQQNFQLPPTNTSHNVQNIEQFEIKQIDSKKSEKRKQSDLSHRGSQNAQLVDDSQKGELSAKKKIPIIQLAPMNTASKLDVHDIESDSGSYTPSQRDDQSRKTPSPIKKKELQAPQKQKKKDEQLELVQKTLQQVEKLNDKLDEIKMSGRKQSDQEQIHQEIDISDIHNVPAEPTDRQIIPQHDEFQNDDILKEQEFQEALKSSALSPLLEDPQKQIAKLLEKIDALNSIIAQLQTGPQSDKTIALENQKLRNENLFLLKQLQKFTRFKEETGPSPLLASVSVSTKPEEDSRQDSTLQKSFTRQKQIYIESETIQLQNALKPIPRIYICLICLEPLQKPVTLACQHSFCQRCLELYGQLECPFIHIDGLTVQKCGQQFEQIPDINMELHQTICEYFPPIFFNTGDQVIAFEEDLAHVVRVTGKQVALRLLSGRFIKTNDVNIQHMNPQACRFSTRVLIGTLVIKLGNHFRSSFDPAIYYPDVMKFQDIPEFSQCDNPNDVYFVKEYDESFILVNKHGKAIQEQLLDQYGSLILRAPKPGECNGCCCTPNLCVVAVCGCVFCQFCLQKLIRNRVPCPNCSQFLKFRDLLQQPGEGTYVEQGYIVLFNKQPVFLVQLLSRTAALIFDLERDRRIVDIEELRQINYKQLMMALRPVNSDICVLMSDMTSELAAVQQNFVITATRQLSLNASMTFCRSIRLVQQQPLRPDYCVLCKRPFKRRVILPCQHLACRTCACIAVANGLGCLMCKSKFKMTQCKALFDTLPVPEDEKEDAAAVKESSIRRPSSTGVQNSAEMIENKRNSEDPFKIVEDKPVTPVKKTLRLPFLTPMHQTQASGVETTISTFQSKIPSILLRDDVEIDVGSIISKRYSKVNSSGSAFGFIRSYENKNLEVSFSAVVQRLRQNDVVIYDVDKLSIGGEAFPNDLCQICTGDYEGMFGLVLGVNQNKCRVLTEIGIVVENQDVLLAIYVRK